MLKVTEADHQAYLAWSNLPPRDREAVLAGEWDETTGMQVLARHRLASEKAEREACAKAARKRAGEWKAAISNGLKRVSVSKAYAEGAMIEAEVIAAAIEAQAHGI
ncbi:hypothetical protein JI59_16165 [Novosphingobium pentaromativorans US6-1]|nr:hypothetical protein JI59_16165 [Novosphingobium pentaromativorans US6-1]